MRITSSMMADQFLTDANASLNRVAKAQQEVDSTKRISNIDDDPLATLSSLRARNKLSSLSEYQASITSANSTLKESANAVDSMNEVVKSAYDLMVSVNSGAKNESDYSAVADELAGLRDEILSIANGTIGTAYLFNGNSSKQPFTVNSTTGHLSYNGIDLTQFALQDDIDAAKTSADTANAAIGTYDSSTGAYTDGLMKDLSGSSEYYARTTICPQIIEQMNTMIDSGTAAIQYANQSSDSEDTAAMQKAVENMTKLRDALQSETSKSLKTDLISGGMTDEDATALCFNLSNIQTLLTCGNAETDPEKKIYSLNYCCNGDSAVDGTEGITDSLQKLQEDVTDATSDEYKTAQAQLLTESTAHKTLQIGVTQTVETSINGLELMGVSVTDTGTTVTVGDETMEAGKAENSNLSNVYYILDKCVKALNGDLDMSAVDGMTDTLLSVQSNLLSQETKIGTSQNRMTMISDRYVNSNLTYTGMKSDAEDADMASAIVNLTSAKTVYNAALAAGAKIIQTSLVDFLS
jgi:flagellar hook-associated protein 3 FlgL